MRINKLLVNLAFSMLFSSGVTIAADYDKGMHAYNSGDFKTALAEWTPIAEQGDARAQATLGIMYGNGDGVPQNDKIAVYWYAKAAEQGHAKAQYHLGLSYSYGQGVPQNDKTAVKWYAKAAAQGLAGAQNSLGGMYQDGDGVLEDDNTAVKWYTKSAEQGDADGQLYLGIMYFGALSDTRRAYMWLKLSSYNGNEKAGEITNIVAKEMTPADISKAQDMSSRCLESNYTDC